MTKKSLEEKINCVKWSTLLFAIIYFSIGAWLKSDGPNFDSTKAYELIRDTLTITAAFLAPVAAFVLFTDWRDQHRAIKNEKISLEIKPLLTKLNVFINNPVTPAEYKSGEVGEAFFAVLMNIRAALEGVSVFDENSQSYRDSCLQILRQSHQFWETRAQEVYWIQLHDEYSRGEIIEPDEETMASYRKRLHGHHQKRLEISKNLSESIADMKILHVD
ncbi:hypothetical protein [Acinetobacter indicus]|uniref:hypothetical protein n=1 Tax=Acinetobacter indicus TaxID=756892 RepID=UPI001444695F|nr:hypothetical protein [Acinetobacter indicus]